MANPEIAALWNDYQLVMNDFKETHKAHSDSRMDSDKFRELRSDIGIIDSEKENGNSSDFGCVNRILNWVLILRCS